ncbi:MAG: spermidine synthase [Chloroflexi bacterium]|nr:spermidine synthase [Chloroflexota bacterium]
MTGAWPGAFTRRKDFQLFLTSFLALYAELLCIRWMPAHVRFLSYFTNFILLASFLGLGVGILSVRRRLPLGPRTFPLILLAAAILIAATKFELKIGSAGVLYYGAGESGSAPPENALVLPAAFLVVSLLFVCIGRPLGILLQEVTPPLRAYAFDIGGSLAGIAAFFALSWFEQPPAIWFVGLLIITLLLIGPTWRDRAFMIVPLAIATLIAYSIGQGFWWSPYYKIGLTPTDNGDGWALNVNNSGHQAMLPSDEKEPFYRAPYELFGSGQFQHALIIGAGSGSDTAIGLKYGNVGHIDAVEIDPVIAQLGAEFHPEQPFSDPRVTVHVDDGRSFIRKSDDKYDLIIFALPDSLTLTSQFSSLRLESFLFTEEAFKEARAHLTPDGAMVLYNYYRDDWLIRKLAGMLEDAYGQAPYVQSFGGWGRAGVLVDGPRLQTLLAQHPEMAQPYTEIRAPTPQLNEDPNAILLPLVGQGVLDHNNYAGDDEVAPPTPATDDWPLMYLRDPSMPWVYVAGLAMVGVIALGLIFGLAPPGARRGFSLHMFFLGAAFMLLETRSLVTFSLLFGSTWLVNSLVFFAILCSVMLAVFLSSRFPIRPSVPLYVLLVATLLLAYFVPQEWFLSINVLPLRYALASLVAFAPVFVANLVFAGSFKGTGLTANVAFASNLIGIMVGGALEYASLLIGYRNLLLIVILFYLVSAALLRRRAPAEVPETDDSRLPVPAT